MLNFNYTDCRGISIPLGYEIITKSEDLVDDDGKFIKKISKYSKNEIFREKLGLLNNHNQVKYKYVLADKWFASIDNMGYIDKVLGKKFIFPIKKNRKVAFSLEDKIKGRYVIPFPINNI